MAELYFPYGDEEVTYLARKDKKLAAVMEQLGHPNRPINPDLFSSVVNSIVGQQISTKAHQTVWARMQDGLGAIDAASICAAPAEQLQSYGMTFRKADYIKEFAGKVQDGSFDLDAVSRMSDQEAIDALSGLHGIGVWTAEMILLHCLERPDILSFGDLAIIRGMRMVYRHRKITREQFERYRRRYSPYGSVASIYLWKVSAFAIPGLTDPAPKPKPKPKSGPESNSKK